MKNKDVKNLLIRKYGNECWLKYKLTRDNQLTLHHIKPRRSNGATNEENGALLSRLAHNDFNRLEQRYPELASEINMYLKTFKGNYPNEVLDRINKLMKLVEKKEEREKSKVKTKRR
jgi:hypothetical protein